MANTADISGVNGNNVFGLKALSNKILSTLFNKCVLLAALGIMDSNKSDGFFDPGSPEAGILISGADVNPAMRREIGEASQYSPLLEAIRQDDVADQPYRGRMPTLATGDTTNCNFTVTVTNGAIASVTVNNGGTGFAGAPPTIIAVDNGTGFGAYLTATVSGGVITAITVAAGGYGYGTVTILVNVGKTAGEKDARPVFKWTDKSRPCYVYNRDVRRQEELARGQQDLFNQGVNSLTTAEQARGAAALIQFVERDAFTGSPTSQTADLWDHQPGLNDAISLTNTYGGLDRSLTANYYWRAPTVSTALNLTLEGLYADAMYTRGLSNNGGNVNCIITGPTLFSKYQKESQAYTINANTDPNIQVMKRQFGFNQEVIKYNGCYVLMDPNCAPSYAYVINPQAWIFATRTGANFAFGGWQDQTKIEGGIDGFYGVMRLQYMLMCVAPQFGQALYSNLS